MRSHLHFAEKIKLRAAEAGFELCGVASVHDEEGFPELEYFPEWVAQGQAGEMEYLKARNEQGKLKRSALGHAAPWAKSVIICAINYNSARPYSIDVDDASRGWISRYAWFEQKNSPDAQKPKATDYHDAVLSRLRRMESAMIQDWRQQYPEIPLQTRCYVDTGPLVERVYAKYAGVGWVGKNTCIINQGQGSWIFLGSILTSIEFRSDDSGGEASAFNINIPAPDRCGSCTRCIDACPTDALIAPYKMDARRCIAYLTIEKRGEIPEEFRAQMGRHVFGCDICQDVCPWNGNQKAPEARVQNGDSHRAPLTHADEFHAREELVAPKLEWLAKMSRDEFNQMFRGSPIKRAKYEGIRRNTAIAMGNSGNREFIPQLEKMAQDPDANVAEHARWAIQKLSSMADSRPR